jgi:hypothetical protein
MKVVWLPYLVTTILADTQYTREPYRQIVSAKGNLIYRLKDTQMIILKDNQIFRIYEAGNCGQSLDDSRISLAAGWRRGGSQIQAFSCTQEFNILPDTRGGRHLFCPSWPPAPP